jgi:hypothetical protein
MGSTYPGSLVRCTYCGGRGDGALIEVDLRGIRYDYCDAACATAHRQAVELTRVLCVDCDLEAVGDSGCCDEHVVPVDVEDALSAASWRRAG